MMKKHLAIISPLIFCFFNYSVLADDLCSPAQQKRMLKKNISQALIDNICNKTNIINSTPENLAKAVISTLSTHNKKHFSSFAVADKKTVINFIKKTFPKEKHNVMMARVKHKYDKMKNDALDSWDKVYQHGIKDGVDWNNVSYESVKYKIKERDNIKQTDIYVILNSNNTKYKLKLDDCAFIDGKWYLLDEMKWKGKLEKTK